MGTGYTRNDTSNNIADGNIINAADLDGEFDAIESAFGTSGHTHDGTSAEGGPITVLGPVQDFVASATEIKPKTTNTLDIGTSGLLFKDMYLDGVATLGSIKIDNAGTIGSASDSDAIAISSGGVVTFSQAPFVDVTNATTNAVTDVLGIQVQSSGTPAVGIGSGLTLGVETASGNVETAGAIRIVSTGLTPTDEEIDLVFYSMRNGSLTEGFRYDSSADSLDVTGILTVSGSSTSTFNSGAENVVATFTSTDTEAQINLVDSTGSAQIRSRNDLRFYTNGGSTRAMDIDSGGKVGINEDSPQTKLHIKNSSVGESWSAYSGTVATLEENSSNGGVLQFVTNSSYTGEIWFGDADARNQGRIRYEHANDKLELWANAAERIGIESTGKVIIQTPTSGTALEVNLIDNAADGFMVKQGSNEYISVDTTNSSEKVLLGNTTTNPKVGIGNTSPSAILDVKSTSAVMTTLRGTSSSIAYLDLTNYATSGNGVGSGIELRANSSTQERQVGFITAEWTDNTDATRDSRMDFDININGGTTAALRLGVDEITVNGGGHDTDFRVESNNESNMLFVDAGNNRLGIRTNAPASTLHIDSDNASGTTYGIVQNDGAVNTNTIAGWVIRDGSTVMSGIRRRRDGSASPTEIGNFSSDERVDFLQNNESCIRFNTDSSIVVNEGSYDKDFRVESANQSSMLGVDASGDTVFIFDNSLGGTNDASLVVNSDDAKHHAVKLRAGSTVNGMSLIGDNYQADESQFTLGLSYSSSHVVLARGVKPSDTTDDVYLSSQDTYNTAPSALVLTNKGMKFLSTTTSTINTTDAAVTLYSYFEMDENTSTFNDFGGNRDFRIESDGASHMFFVDASANRIGMGESSPDEPLHLTTTDDADVVKIESTNVGSNHGPNLRLLRNSSSPADNDMIGRVNMNGMNSAGEELTFGQLLVQMRDVTDGTEDARLKLGGLQGGTFVNYFDAEPTETIINQDSVDRDFRVESDSTSHALYVSGSDTGGIGSVAIGGSTMAKIGISGNGALLHLHGDDSQLRQANGCLHFDNSGNTTYHWRNHYGATSSSAECRVETGFFRVFTGTSFTEAMRVTASGDLNTTGAGTFNRANAGFTSRNGDSVSITRSAGTPLEINRTTSDGPLINFFQAGVVEGQVSVSGSTVSYNGGHLARWSQLTDGSKDTSIVKGTVMTNLDQMCVWRQEAVDAVLYEEGDLLPEGVSVGDIRHPATDAYDEDNEQLNCMAVSSTEGDPNVAGVFVNWDDDNDMNIAMTGDMVIRIAQGTTVSRGDLLMSAGDGTAKPQGDDIVRSKTIAKVTSTNVSHTYNDGSYLVPCVLMAC